MTVKTTGDAVLHTFLIEARLSAPELATALIAGARLPLALYRIGGQGAAPVPGLASAPHPEAELSWPEGFGTLQVDF